MKWGIGGAIASIVFCFLTIIGWVINIFATIGLLINETTIVITGKLILRVIGILVVPLGSIMGWFF